DHAPRDDQMGARVVVAEREPESRVMPRGDRARDHDETEDDPSDAPLGGFGPVDYNRHILGGWRSAARRRHDSLYCQSMWHRLGKIIEPLAASYGGPGLLLLAFLDSS